MIKFVADSAFDNMLFDRDSKDDCASVESLACNSRSIKMLAGSARAAILKSTCFFRINHSFYEQSNLTSYSYSSDGTSIFARLSPKEKGTLTVTV